MENTLKTELRLITITMSSKNLTHLCNIGMEICSSMQKTSILEDIKTNQLWANARKVILEDTLTRKAFLLSEIEKWEFEPKEKKELIDLFLITWDAGYDENEIVKIRKLLLLKTERRIAHKLIFDFQKRLESDDFSLLQACDEFYGNSPVLIQ